MSNTTIISDPYQLTNGDLIEEYEKLSTAYRLLKRSEEQQLQQIYELRRTVQTVTNAETHLAAELEFIASGHASELQLAQQRHRAELEDVRAKLAEAQELNATADTENDQLRRDIVDLHKSIDDLKMASDQPKPDPVRDKQMADSLARAEKDNDLLLQTLTDERERLATALKQIVQLERAIEDLRDQLECTECTLQNKRDEVEARTLEHEAAQEKIIQLTEELSTLRTEPCSDTEKRGNSLFAEVDDQRQHMKQVLAAQKKHYVQMKQQFGQSQQEIRSLKRENAAMKKEMEICGTMFLNADQTFKEKLYDRIGKLMAEIQHMEKKVSFMENKLLSVANDKGVSWLDSMLSFCKNETALYKEQLRLCRLQKATAEEALNNVELDLARWRFEALKSRCTIIHREQLLEENRIAFEADPQSIGQLVRKMEQKNPRPVMDATKVKMETRSVSDSPKCYEVQIEIFDETIAGNAKVELDVESTAQHVKIEEDDKENIPKMECFSPVQIEDISTQSISMDIESPAIPDASRPPLTPRPDSTAANSAVNLPQKLSESVKPKVTFSPDADSEIRYIRPIAISQLSARPNIKTEIPKATVPPVYLVPKIESTNTTGPKIRQVIVKSKKPTLYPN